MTRLLTLSLRYRFFTLVAILLVLISGAWSLTELTIDAVPDLTPVQVQVLTRAPALGPIEVEQFVTFPIERALSGLPGLKTIRSVSRYGLSAVTAIFEDHMDPFLTRQLVNERVIQAAQQIPSEYGRPLMGPMTTGLGEVYQFILKGAGYSPMELRTLLEWDIATRLRSVPGVVEVNIWGGEDKQYQVVVDPQKLLAFDLSLQQVFTALERNNALVGGGYIQHEREQFLIRGEALVADIADLGRILVDHHPGGIPVYIDDVAHVREGAALRIGAATAMGDGETVIGMVQMITGGNAQRIVEDVKVRIRQIGRTLPRGVMIEPYYDRADFVSKVIRTVRNNLTEGGLLVIAILFLFLGDLRAGLIVASAIPFSMLIAFSGMLQLGISGNLMSLGAIDFGLLVDGSVVMIDNILRKLGHSTATDRDQRLAVIHEAAREVIRPVTFAVGIIILVYVPILALTGIEGKMFQPMALTVILALAGSLIFAVTAVPVLSFWFARGNASNQDTWVLRHLRRVYEPCLRFSLGRPAYVAFPAIGLFVISLGIGWTLGVVFVPRLDEGDMAIQVWRLPSISIDESVKTAMAVERSLRQFPEVVKVVTRTGSPEIATDVMGIELSDVFVVLKPYGEWTSARTKEELIEKMRATVLKAVHGVGLSFTQPIEMRFNEMTAGVRSDVAIKIFGDDLEVLRKHAERVARTVEQVPGAADVRIEQVSGIPRIRVKIYREQIARYGINADDVLGVVQAVRVGKVVGTVFEGRRRFDLVVRLAPHASEGRATLANLLVPTPHGELVPLSRVADVMVDEGPAQISREDVRRKIIVECNIRGRDLGGFIAEAQKAVHRSVNLPVGYYIEWGGQFEHLQKAKRRLAVVVPITLIMIIAVLSLIFGTLRHALLIFLNVPLAITGGILALFSVREARRTLTAYVLSR